MRIMKVPGSLFKVYSWPCIEYSNGLVIKKLLNILAKGHLKTCPNCEHIVFETTFE